MEAKKNKKRTKVQTNKVLDAFFTINNVLEYKRTEKRMQLALRLGKAIKHLGWSKTKFAQEMKTHPSVISKWLSGEHNFTFDTLSDIEEKLKICIINVAEPKIIETVRYKVIEIAAKSHVPTFNPFSTFSLDYQFICNKTFSTQANG